MDPAVKRRQNFRSKRRNYFWLFPALLTLFTLFHYTKSFAYPTENVGSGGRHLLSSLDADDCVSPAINEFPNDFFTQEQRLQGGIAIHIILSFFMCYALAIVCDDYFVPSLAGLSDALNLSSDVAGATFMAAGTSAPELFTSVVGSFITEGDIGIGTIVGSAVFNILAVVSFCGLLAGSVIPLEWWPLTRDCLAYTFAVIALIVVLLNDSIQWYEAVVFIVMFFLYIVVMYFNESIQQKVNGWMDNYQQGKATAKEKKTLLPHDHRVRTYSALSNASDQSGVGSGHGHVRREPTDIEKGEKLSASVETKTEETKKEVETSLKENNLKEMLENSFDESDGHIFSMPYYNPFKQVSWVLMWPVKFVFYITIPDCRTERWQNWYPITFLVSITYIGGLSYLLSWMVTIIGHTFGIPDTVMGLTFLAAGTSVPEAISSVIVCRQGFGNMALSNSVASNVFDILFCLGVPWLIKSVMSPPDYSVRINSKGLEYSVIALLTTVVFMFATMALNRFRLDKRVGLACLILYAAFIVVSSLFELNVFGQVNLPTCVE